MATTRPVCANCYKRDADKRCSKCGCYYYCSRECQVAHWRSSHKERCEMKPSSDKQGIGLLALNKLNKYDIAVEREATIGPGGDFSSQTDDRLPSSTAVTPHSEDAEFYQLDLRGVVQFLSNEDLDSFLTKFKLATFCLVAKMVFNHEPPADIMSEATEKLLHRVCEKPTPKIPGVSCDADLVALHLNLGSSLEVAKVMASLFDLPIMIFSFRKNAILQWNRFKSLVPSLCFFRYGDNPYLHVMSSLLNDLAKFSSQNCEFDFKSNLDAVVGPLLRRKRRYRITPEIDFKSPPKYPFSYQYQASTSCLLIDYGLMEGEYEGRLGDSKEYGYPSHAQLRAMSGFSEDEPKIYMSITTLREDFAFLLYVDECSPELTSEEVAELQVKNKMADRILEYVTVPKKLAACLWQPDPDPAAHAGNLVTELSDIPLRADLEDCVVDPSLHLPDIIAKTKNCAVSKSPSESVKKARRKRQAAVNPGCSSDSQLEQQSYLALAELAIGDFAKACRQLSEIISLHDLSLIDPETAASIHALHARLLLSENLTCNDIEIAEKSISAAKGFVAGKFQFPAVDLLLAKTFIVKYQFADAKKLLDQLLVYVEGSQAGPIRYPFLVNEIPWTSREGLLAEIRRLQLLVNYPPPPDYRCRFLGCEEPSLYVNPYPGFPYNSKGYAVLACSQKCVAAYHVDCWKHLHSALAKLDLGFDDKDIRARIVPCVTPTCLGAISKVDIYREDGTLKTSFECGIPMTKRTVVFRKPSHDTSPAPQTSAAKPAAGLLDPPRSPSPQIPTDGSSGPGTGGPLNLIRLRGALKQAIQSYPSCGAGPSEVLCANAAETPTPHAGGPLDMSRLHEVLQKLLARAEAARDPRSGERRGSGANDSSSDSDEAPKQTRRFKVTLRK